MDRHRDRDRDINHKLDVRLVNGSTLKLSVFRGELLFMHSEFISAQFDLDMTGIGVHDQITSIKIEFHTLTPNNNSYQGWFAEKDQLDELLEYFKMLGYKCDQYHKISLEGEK